MQTIGELFYGITDRYHGVARPAYLHKRDGAYVGITYDQLRQDVEAYALALDALGVEAGDRIGIVSENRYEWVLTDFATLLAGGVDVPMFPTLSPKQIAYILNHSQATICVVSTQHQLDKLRAITDELSDLTAIIIFDSATAPMTLSAGQRSIPVHPLAELLQQGKEMLASGNKEQRLASLLARSRPDDLCTIIYTSGTTGVPKGVMLTHRNILSNVEAARAVIEVRENDVFLSYLPMSHSYERTTGFYIAFASGATTAFAESLETVRTNLQEVRPTLMTSVPQLFERVRHGIYARMEKESLLRRRFFHWAVAIGLRYVSTLEQQAEPSRGLSLAYRIADQLVFRKIRYAVGGRLRLFVSGGSALSPDVGRFFWAIGLPILEGYGLTEAAPVLTVNRPDDYEFGTVGKPLPGVEVRIDDNGEILARGPNIMRGYWRDPESTAQVLDPDGWLHTGDIGQWTARGNLKITDRIKNLIITSGGKNVAPQLVESVLLRLPFIAQVVVVGDQRLFCAALIVPDEEGLRALAQSHRLDANKPLEQLCADDSLRAVVMREIEHAQRDLAKYERVRRIALLPEPFSIENGLLTPTLKPRRKQIQERYAHVIEQLYADAG
ncbi:MAG: AMP-dependent synthetase [Candidatus Kapaibacterium sp.]|nr:MAG: AMP-dependent synthetase [Candidatus Kapabacteria bacterium]